MDLYLAGNAQDLVCSITLAGAAEEILGRLVVESGGTTSFSDTVDMLCGMHAAAFPDTPPDRKAYELLRNKTRNDFKHLTDNQPFTGSLDREAYSMIRRAMANHFKLGGGFADKYRLVQKAVVDRARERAP
jgi:hypothetical protein